MIGRMRSKITLQLLTSTQDAGGGSTPVLSASYSVWAHVENRNGRQFIGEDQTLWSYDYKVTFRYELSRIPGSNFHIIYDNKRLAINSIAFDEEGGRAVCIARCSAVDETI